MTTLFIAIVEDRHFDTFAEVFSDEQAAIDWVRDQGRTYDRFGLYRERELNDAMTRSGWCFSADAGEDGTRYRVVKVELDARRRVE